MNRLLAAMRWYLLPGFEMERAAADRIAVRSLTLRAVIVHALPRALVIAAFSWSIVTARWYVAAVLGVTMVALGLMSWWVTRWMLKRLGGQHATD